MTRTHTIGLAVLVLFLAAVPAASAASLDEATAADSAGTAVADKICVQWVDGELVVHDCWPDWMPVGFCVDFAEEFPVRSFCQG